MSENKAENQLPNHAKINQFVCNKILLTTSSGSAIGDKLNSLTAGQNGPILLQDITLIDELAHFDRERIPERVVHAKGGGAFGYFEVTHDITRYTKNCVFKNIGKRTNMVARFSVVGGESGSADTARDPRGFALKFYTEDGIWDLVGNNTPIFFIRDPILFPSFIHSKKRNPVTHLKDANMFWDFITLRPETTHQVMILFSDRGTPDGFRFMHGFSSHAYKLVNNQNQVYFARFHFKTDQGIKNLTPDEATRLAGEDPDYSIRDLYNAIANGNYPSWTLYIQVVSEADIPNFKFNPFDLTKVWPLGEYPLQPVGKMVLNKNPQNFFAEIEQLAFSPSHLIPGIEPSPDKMLQARLFSYSDTQRHRLGPNHLQIPVNSPINRVDNYQRDGFSTVDGNQFGAPNYYPNSFCGPQQNKSYLESSYEISGYTGRYDTSQDDNFGQPRVFWNKVLDKGQRERLVQNIADHIVNAADFIQKRAIDNFSNVDPEFGRQLRIAIEKNMKKKCT